jgi:antitoxin VapB
MVQLPKDTERLAQFVAERTGQSAEEVVRRAVEREAGILGVRDKRKQRMSAAEMLAFGARVSAMPLLDPRSPQEIIDGLSEI